MKLFVARHGQTAWNIQNKVCSVTDVALTEQGKQQAAALAELVQQRGIDFILCSPLGRARETAEIVAQKCGIPLQAEPLLMEQNYGIFEGADRANPDFLANKRNFAFRYPQGESVLQVACRVYRLLDSLKQRYPDKNILLVSHGGVCRIIHTYFVDMTNEEFFGYTAENGKLTEYEL